MDFSHLTTSTLLLTPNRRLQEYWSEQYNLYQHQLGNQVWQAPAIYSFAQWIELQWDALSRQLQRPLVRLSDIQTTYLFEQLIRQQDSPLLNVTATAKNVIAAWNLLRAWDLTIADWNADESEDTRWFCQIAQAFTEYCATAQVIDASSAINHIITGLAEQQLPAIKQLFYSGFSEWTPQQQRLLNTLQLNGCKITEVAVPTFANKSRRLALQNAEAEIESAARWAKQSWQDGLTSIACVIPDLAHCRARVERIFREQFSDCTHLPVNISGGMPLATFPIIHSAFLCFKLCVSRMDLQDVGCWLRSPYLAKSETERSIRASIDWALSDSGEKHATRAWLQKQIDPAIAPELSRILALCQLPASNATPRVWAKRFSDLLCALGWPGERELDSLEYQCTERWLRLLDEFATLSHYTQEIDAMTAINLCQKLAASSMFQAQSAVEPIQVVGLLEAIGHPFTAIWLMGLHDEVWPASAKPNPFIPLGLQRQHNMPHASAERELAYCQQMTAHFQHAAEQVYFSYPLQTEDRSNACSRLLLTIPEINFADLKTAPLVNRAKILKNSAKLSTFTDNQAPPLLPTEAVRGGSFILKSMATCPFQAFAKHRLGAKQPTVATIGLSGSERGLLIHSALEFFWTEMRTQENLLKLSVEQEAALIDQAIDHALKPLFAKHSLRFTPEFFICERGRLTSTLHRYLQLEKKRPPFTVVGIETPITTTLAGISFKLRCDRIDKTHTGETLVIDYKTALIQISDWFSARPTEPQLPLYAISTDEIKGLVVMQLKSHSLAFQGISSDSLEIAGVQPLEKFSRYTTTEDWNEQLDQWRSALTELASLFQQGHAAVDPKKAKVSCQHCDLPGLCRVQE